MFSRLLVCMAGAEMQGGGWMVQGCRQREDDTEAVKFFTRLSQEGQRHVFCGGYLRDHLLHTVSFQASATDDIMEDSVRRLFYLKDLQMFLHG